MAPRLPRPGELGKSHPNANISPSHIQAVVVLLALQNLASPIPSLIRVAVANSVDFPARGISKHPEQKANKNHRKHPNALHLGALRQVARYS